MTPGNVARADAAESTTGLLDVLTRAEGEGVEVINHGGQLVLWPPGKASPDLEVLVRQNTRDEERAVTAKYRALLDAVKQYLKDPKVVRVGERQVTV
jgi:hypothetical protein